MGSQNSVKIKHIEKGQRHWIVVGEKPAEVPVRHDKFETARTAACKLALRNPDKEFSIYHVCATVKAKAPDLVEGQPSQGATAGLDGNAVATTC